VSDLHFNQELLKVLIASHRPIAKLFLQRICVILHCYL